MEARVLTNRVEAEVHEVSLCKWWRADEFVGDKELMNRENFFSVRE